jgi:hypothetical protein
MFYACNNLKTAVGSDRYVRYTLRQGDMFAGCYNLETPLPYCAIPTDWGGGGTCLSLILSGTTSVIPKWSTDGDPLQYKLGAGEWTDAVSGENITTNDIISFRGNGRTSLFNSSDESNAWVITGDDVIINGNFNCLLDYEDESLLIGENSFAYLLYGNESITTVNATLPSTVVAQRCYYSMFRDCTGLTVAPILPATELVKYCYYYMFMNCTSLVEAPGANRYMNYIPNQGAMFGNCKALLKPISYLKLTDNWK